MIVFLLLLSSIASAQERVVLRTDYGDIVAEVDESAAPKHVALFLDQVRSGAFDGSAIPHIDSARMIRVAGPKAEGAPPPKETSRLKHAYGTLTFAHGREDDGARTSFAIMLADVPAMDGHFAAFGKVVDGFDVLETMRSLPVDAARHPMAMAGIVKAFLRDPAPPPQPAVPLMIAVLGGLAFLLGRRNALLTSVGLLAVLAGYFLLFAAYLPAAQTSPSLGLLLFATGIAIFRLMALFEKSWPPKKTTPSPVRR